ncbi:MAG: Hsp70 family protein, partial [Treponema sp.]|nr:Hsp70 family protein [Treponema sp.]
DIDANGIVHVSAKDLGTGKEQKIRIESSSGLNEQDIERMVKEAELHAEEDKREREKAEVHNEADTMIYSTEKNLKELGDKISAEDKSKTEEAIAELRRAMEGGDIQTIKDKTEALKQVSYKIAEELYKQQAAQQGAQGAAGPGAGPEAGPSAGPGSGDSSAAGSNTKSAEDADYEVVDDNK